MPAVFRRPRTLAAALALSAQALLIFGCGDGSGQNPGDGSVDAPGDAGGASGNYGHCPQRQATEPPRGPGGCCTNDTDCTPGFCLGGWCTADCTSDDGCNGPSGIAVPTPFGPGTRLRCLSEPNLGVRGFCWPGSGAPCSGPGGTCADGGETCGIWFSEQVSRPDAGTLVPNALVGRCITRFASDAPRGTGEACGGQNPYECSNPLGLFKNCLADMCTQGCDPLAPMGCAPGTVCFGPVQVAMNPLTYTGAGLCTGPSCGRLQASNPASSGDVQTILPRDQCGPGRYCAPFNFKGDQPDTLWLQCANASDAGELAGGACQQDRKLKLYCQHQAACLQAGPVANPSGAACLTSDECPGDDVCVTPDGQYAQVGRLGSCSAPPPQGFCSQLCRNDADCALPGQPFGASPICLEVFAGHFPNGASGKIPYCFAHERAFPTDNPLRCFGESICASADKTSCIPASMRSMQSFCLPGEPADPNGATCSTPRASCGSGSLCLRAPDDTLHCTDVSSALAAGSICQNGTGPVCASGLCWDRAGQAPTSSPGTTRCTTVCQTSFECVQSTTCMPVRLQDNGTPADPSDDTVLGFCLTQTPASAAEHCGSDNDCVNTVHHGDHCNTGTQACSLSTAQTGDACTNDADCPQAASCLLAPAYPGGECVLYGCDAATGAGCPTGTTCLSQPGGVGACLRSCPGGSGCRAGYHCETGTMTCQPG